MRPCNLRRVIVLQGLTLRGLRDIGAPYAVEPAVRWSDADDVVREAPPSAVVMVNPYAGASGGAGFPRLRELLRRFPSTTVVAAMPLSPENVGDVNTLMEWGVSEVVDSGPECTGRAIQARLRQAHARPLKRRLERALSAYVGGEARELLLGAAEVAVEGGGAPELARVLRMAPRTLTERCTRADVPHPRQVQAWMRVLLACMLLDDPGRTVYATAYACGYTTDRSLRRLVGSYLGADATTLRRGGAFAQAARAFNGRLRELREVGRERRRRERARSEA